MFLLKNVFVKKNYLVSDNYLTFKNCTEKKKITSYHILHKSKLCIYIFKCTFKVWGQATAMNGRP